MLMLLEDRTLEILVEKETNTNKISDLSELEMQSFDEHDINILKITREEVEEFFKLAKVKKSGSFIFR